MRLLNSAIFEDLPIALDADASHRSGSIVSVEFILSYSPSTVTFIMMAHLPSLFTWFRRIKNNTLKVLFFIFTSELVSSFVRLLCGGCNDNVFNIKMDWTLYGTRCDKSATYTVFNVPDIIQTRVNSVILEALAPQFRKLCRTPF